MWPFEPKNIQDCQLYFIITTLLHDKQNIFSVTRDLMFFKLCTAEHNYNAIIFSSNSRAFRFCSTWLSLWDTVNHHPAITI